MPDGRPIPMILVVNKYDLIEEMDQAPNNDKLEDYMTQGFLDDFADKNGFIGAVRTSAKTGHNVNMAFG